MQDSQYPDPLSPEGVPYPDAHQEGYQREEGGRPMPAPVLLSSVKGAGRLIPFYQPSCGYGVIKDEVRPDAQAPTS